MGIHAVYPEPNLSKRNFKEAIVPYLLRNKMVFFPNQVWSIDITYIKMYHGHMYLTAIIDWFSRKIVGWTLSDTLDTRPVLEAVQKAVETCGVPAILNSDQGSQFTSEKYKQMLKELHICQSMDGKSRWADNVALSLGKRRSVSLFDFRPRNGLGVLHPAITLFQIHARRLLEVRKADLSVAVSVHMSPQVQGFCPFSLHLVL